MAIKTITCRGCEAKIDVECDGPATQIAEVSAVGWGFIWDISNGLSTVWICGTCADTVARHANEILKVTKVEDTHFGQLLRPRGKNG